MSTQKRLSLSERFNLTADEINNRMTDPWVIGATCGLAVLLAPFSGTVAMMALATPTVYLGVAVAYRLLGAAVNQKALPQPEPSPH